MFRNNTEKNRQEGKETRIERELLCRESESEIALVQKVKELEGFVRLCVSECCVCGALPFVGTSVLEMWLSALDSESSGSR